MELPVLQVKILNDAVLQFGSLRTETSGSAGYDLRACVSTEVVIPPGHTESVPTGIAIFISDRNFAGLIFPRSGLALKHQITLQNAVGLIDSDYQGELIVLLRNEGHVPFRVAAGDRVAQLVIMPVMHPSVSIVREFFGASERGVSGFGSTGVISRPLVEYPWPAQHPLGYVPPGYPFPTQNLGNDDYLMAGVQVPRQPVYDATDQEMLESEYGEG